MGVVLLLLPPTNLFMAQNYVLDSNNAPVEYTFAGSTLPSTAALSGVPLGLFNGELAVKVGQAGSDLVPTGTPHAPIAAVAGSTTNIPIGAFDIGVLIQTGTGTILGTNWPALLPFNVAGKIATTIPIILANPGTALITYST